MDALNIYPFPVYQVLNVNWSALLNGILPTLQSHGWYNGTHGGCQLGSGDLGLLPLAMWSTGVLLATVWVSWLLMGCSKQGFCHLPLHPVPPHHSPPPIPPTPSICNTDGRNRCQKYHEIQPSKIEKVNYNKNH